MRTVMVVVVVGGGHPGREVWGVEARGESNRRWTQTPEVRRRRAERGGSYGTKQEGRYGMEETEAGVKRDIDSSTQIRQKKNEAQPHGAKTLDAGKRRRNRGGSGNVGQV